MTDEIIDIKQLVLAEKLKEANEFINLVKLFSNGIVDEPKEEIILTLKGMIRAYEEKSI